ncbi:hypothetical protein ACPV5S_06125 [Vibrio astriarenae]
MPADKAACWIALGICTLSMTARACDLFDSPTYSSNGSVDSVVVNSSGFCYSVQESLNFVSDTFANLMVSESTNQFDFDTEYWDQWLIKSQSDPFLTQRLANNYFGLGVWMPSKLEDDVDQMSYDEWLLSHGLQFSFGVGDKKAGEPRLRFDYRWHEKHQGDFFMQFEIPIK